MGERILALKQKLIETLKARFSALPEAGDIKEKAQAKFDLSSIDYWQYQPHLPHQMMIVMPLLSLLI